jgi:DNA repair protein RAD57
LLSGVHKLTSAISTPEALLHVLRNIIPSLLSPPTAPAKPAKLLVIDSLTPLFRLTNTSLFDRSRYLHEIGSLLHGIASKYCMAIVVINEVSDVFEAVAFSPSTSEISQASASVSAPGTEGKEKGKAKAKPHAYGDGEVELTYKDQSRWFNRSAFSEDKKEAGLGLVWANIVNGRIVLRRTAELFYLHDPSPSEALGYDAGEGEGEGEGGRKRRKTNDGSSIALQPQPQLQQQSTIIRRLSLIFSGLCAPFEVPFVVLKEGVRVLPPPPAIQSELSATVEAETGADIEVENEEDEEDKKTEVDEYEVSEWGSEVWGSLPVGVGGTATTGLADVDEGS